MFETAAMAHNQPFIPRHWKYVRREKFFNGGDGKDQEIEAEGREKTKATRRKLRDGVCRRTKRQKYTRNCTEKEKERETKSQSCDNVSISCRSCGSQRHSLSRSLSFSLCHSLSLSFSLSLSRSRSLSCVRHAVWHTQPPLHVSQPSVRFQVRRTTEGGFCPFLLS